MAEDGSLNTDGARRARAAIMVKAYGGDNETANDLLNRSLESTDDNTAAIGKALLDAAPAMIRLRDLVGDGKLKPSFDIVQNIVDAVNFVSTTRERGQGIDEALDQRDILTAVREFVDAEIIPVANELEHADEYPQAIVDGLKEHLAEEAELVAKLLS